MGRIATPPPLTPTPRSTAAASPARTAISVVAWALVMAGCLGWVVFKVLRLPDLSFQSPPWMATGGGPVFWSVLLFLAGAVLVGVSYWFDGRHPVMKVLLAVMRVGLVAFLILLLNRPVRLRIATTYNPSVVAVLIDDSLSMVVRDADEGGADRLALSNAATSLVNPTGPIATQPSTRPAATTQPGTTQPAFAAAATTRPTVKLPEIGTGPTRLDVAQGLLLGDAQRALLRQLAAKHEVHVYRFSSNATALAGKIGAPDPVTKAPSGIDPALVDAVRRLSPEGAETRVVTALNTAVRSLRSERLAGVVVVTDAREIPGQASPAEVRELTASGVNVYGVLVGREVATTRDLAVTYLNVQDSAFKGDNVNAKVGLKATGYGAGPKHLTVKLTERESGAPLMTEDNRPATAEVDVPGEGTAEVEIPFFARAIGTLDVVASVEAEPGELRETNNLAEETVQVLDTKIKVLYVEGYPRWEYRYLKNELIRDKTILVSCLLTSADRNFPQEGDDAESASKFPGRITRFPETPEELRNWDVVIFGDVDPRQFTEMQLRMLADFVGRDAGGFGLIAGPKFAPREYKNQPIEPVLPVALTAARDPASENRLFNQPFSPELTEEGRKGEAATVFRFFTDPKKNEQYLKEELPKLFWFYWGVTEKPGVSRVYAVHETVTGPDGQKAPLLVLGRFGDGRTVFSAIDDTWRWRYYTGESTFDTYWVQLIRYMARGRKIAERGYKFVVEQRQVNRGGRVQVNLNLLNPKLAEMYGGVTDPSRPDTRPASTQPVGKGVTVEVVDAAGKLVRKLDLVREDPRNNLFTGAFDAADLPGRYTIRLPKLGGDDPDFKDVKAAARNYEVVLPIEELNTPTADPSTLFRVTASADQRTSPSTRPAATTRPATAPAAPAAARVFTPVDARDRLANLIPDLSETVVVPHVEDTLWDKWQMLTIFVLLLTTEWVLRKVWGML